MFGWGEAGKRHPLNSVHQPGERPSREQAARRNAPHGCSARPAQVVEIEGYSVTLLRKPIRNAYLRIKGPDGHLEISAPLKMPSAEIAALVSRRRAWIEMWRARYNSNLLEGKSIDTRHWSDARKKAAREVLDERLARLLPHWTLIIGKRPTAIRYRLMSSRWGSCTVNTGIIRLNLVLGELDEDLTELIIVHEMTHLWVSGHGKEFRERMQAYLPDWQERRHRLDEHQLF